jgi:hypothetical protein
MHCLRSFFAAALASAALLVSASAPAAPLFDFDSAGSSFAPARDTLGYAFTVSADLTVDGIGLFDFGGDGLESAHEVALWRSSDPKTPLVSAILNSGTSTAGSDVSKSGLGSFIYKNIVALVLSPGNYVLGASFLSEIANKDAVAIEVAGITPNSADAAYVRGRLGPATGANAIFPIELKDSDRYFGPALRIAVAAVPEPLTLTLLIVGMAGIGLGLRNNASRTRPQSRRRMDALPA